MDKSTRSQSPYGQTEYDFQPAESRLNASREAIKARLNSSEKPHEDRNSAWDTESTTSNESPINSWSSLLLNLVSPSAKNVAGRHPYTLIAGSAIVGAYLAWARPWRSLIGSVIAGAVVRNLVSVGSRNSGRILRHYLNRTPEKKYPPYQKQEHAQ